MPGTITALPSYTDGPKSSTVIVKPITVTPVPSVIVTARSSTAGAATATALSAGGNVNDNQNNNNININVNSQPSQLQAQGGSVAKSSDGLRCRVDMKFGVCVGLVISFVLVQ
jgi:hypothetical protein